MDGHVGLLVIVDEVQIGRLQPLVLHSKAPQQPGAHQALDAKAPQGMLCGEQASNLPYKTAVLSSDPARTGRRWKETPLSGSLNAWIHSVRHQSKLHMEKRLYLRIYLYNFGIWVRFWNYTLRTSPVWQARLSSSCFPGIGVLLGP